MKTLKERISLLVALFILFNAVQAFPWGSATHAYIAAQLWEKSGPTHANEIYGAMAPDVFNFDFAGYSAYLYVQTHYYDFAKIEAVAKGPLQKALAYGFISHNNISGADTTAHTMGRTVGQADGYVIYKAELMANALGPVLQANGLQLPPQAVVEICHNFVESAVDILMAEVHPQIGQEVMKAALLRTSSFSEMLVNAYGESLAEEAQMTPQAAAKIIRAAEKNFRQITLAYGAALMLSPDEAISAQAEQFAQLAPAFLPGVSLPDAATLKALSEFGISQAIDLCSEDFEDEVEATLDWVRGNM